jgi:hypothetical protein
MFDQNTLNGIRRSLKRIFSLPVTRSTYREIQNVITIASNGNADQANVLLETLLTGNLQSDKAKQLPKEELKTLVDEFSISTWVAKDVFERGEFISLITSEMVNVPGQFVYSNRLRRMDGQEFHFVSDIESTLQIIQHFVGRLQELNRLEGGGKQIAAYHKELAQIKKLMDALNEKNK